MPIYHDDLTGKKFKFGYWFVTHRVILRQLGILTLALVSGALFLFGAWSIFDYYILSRAENLSLENEISSAKLNFNLLTEISQPKNLQIISVSALQGGVGKVDLVAEVANPNAQWAVESFDYYFISGSQKTLPKTGFILPGHTKFVLHLGFDSATSFSNPQLVMDNIKWKKTANFKALEDKIMNFEFADKKIFSSKKSSVNAQSAIAAIQFDVINHSVYSFWEPTFVVLFFSGNSLVGATQVVFDSMMTGEKLNADVNVFQDIPANASLQIYPDIDILDPAVFKGFDNE